MLNTQKLLIDAFVSHVAEAYEEMYGQYKPKYMSTLKWAARLALENLANCDCLYHNVEHTVMVVSAGSAILKGKHLCDGGVSPDDWLNFTLAALCHDIGYVRGICRNDRPGIYDTGEGDTVELGLDGTDAMLAPWHVSRGQQFVRERFGNGLLVKVDADLIASWVEMTRFPIPQDEAHGDTTGYGGLLRAADLIGQLGDPKYLRKIPALYFETLEQGKLDDMGFKNPGQMRKEFAQFYWETVRPYVTDALNYLRITESGQRWVANLHSHVFSVEHSDQQTLVR